MSWELRFKYINSGLIYTDLNVSIFIYDCLTTCNVRQTKGKATIFRIYIAVWLYLQLT